MNLQFMWSLLIEIGFISYQNDVKEKYLSMKNRNEHLNNNLLMMMFKLFLFAGVSKSHSHLEKTLKIKRGNVIYVIDIF